MTSFFIGFSKPKNHPFPLISWLIQWVEGKEFSHVYTKWQAKDGEYYIFDVRPPMSRIVSADEFYQVAEPVKEFEIGCTTAKLDELIYECFSSCGISYGWLELIGIGFSKFFRFLGFKSKNPITDKNTIFCTEANYRIYQKLKIMDLQKRPEDVTLSDIFKKLDK